MTTADLLATVLWLRGKRLGYETAREQAKQSEAIGGEQLFANLVRYYDNAVSVVDHLTAMAEQEAKGRRGQYHGPKH